MNKKGVFYAASGLLLGMLRSLWTPLLGRYDTVAIAEVVITAVILFAIFSRRKGSQVFFPLIIFLVSCSVGRIFTAFLSNIVIANKGEFSEALLFALEIELYIIGLIAGCALVLVKKMIAWIKHKDT